MCIRDRDRTYSPKTKKSLNITNLLNRLFRFVGLLGIANLSLICNLHTSSSLYKQESLILELYYTNVKSFLSPIKGKKDQYISPSVVRTSLERL